MKRVPVAETFTQAFPSLLKPSSAPLVFPELNMVSDKWAPRVRGLHGSRATTHSGI